MKVFIIYCHPSKESFTYMIYESFTQGLRAAGHTYITSDLYGMNFNESISEAEYQREGYFTL